MPFAVTPTKRAISAGLVSAAALALAPASAQAQTLRTPVLTEGESWWYSPRLNSVLSFRPCPETTLCARVVWYAPHDRRLSDMFNPGNRNTTPVNMCNFNLRASFQRATPNRWTGNMPIPARNWNVSLRIDGVDVNTVRLHARNGIISSTENLRRVTVGDSRYTNCSPNL